MRDIRRDAQRRSFRQSASEHAMTDIHHTAIREARQFVATGDIPSRHKEVLLEVLTTALREAEARTGSMAMLRSGENWQQHEIETIAAQLQGQIAHNWQHADELAIR